MTQAFNKWLKPALPHLPGAIRSVVRGELAAAVREFYEQSAALRETVDRDVVGAVSSYAVIPDTTNATTVRLLSVAFNGTPLGILPRRPDRVRDPTNHPLGWYRSGVNVVNLWPTPVDALEDGLAVYLTYRPDTSSDTLPDISFEEHFDALFDGMIGRMYRHPTKPYTNLQLADFHLKRFRKAIAEAKGQANKGGVPGGVGWTFNRFGK